MFTPLLQLSDFVGGINTKQRPSKIAPNELVSIIGMDFVANSLQRAMGYSKFGTESEPTLVGKSLYTHRILTGTDVLIKTIGTKIKFYDSVDDAWYLLTDAAFTANLRWSFATFNSYLYGNNGTDSWIFWKGSTLTTITGALSPGGTTIDVQTGKGALFAASGTVMIQDEAITYSGKTGDQLTGCTITAAHAAGSTIVQKLDSTTYVALSKASRISFHSNRLYMIDHDNPNIIRHSKLADNTNPETDLVNFTVAGTGAGDAGYGIAPEEVVSIQQLINGNQTSVLMAMCKDGVAYAFVVTDSSGGTTTNAFIPMRTMNSYPAAAHMVEVCENDVAFVDQMGHIRTLGYGDINTPLNVSTISKNIEPSLEAMAFADGAIKYFKRKLRVTGMTTNAATNNFTFYHDSNYNSWGAHGHLDVVDYAIYNDSLYALSTISGNVWKLEDTYEANGGTYYSEFTTKSLDANEPLVYKTALKMRLCGFITSNCNSYIDFFFDDSDQPITFLVNGDDSDIIGPTPNVAVGSVVFGAGVWGGGLPSGVNRKNFYAELLLNDLVPFFKLAVRVRIDDKNVDFEIQDMLLWMRKESEELWITDKTLKVN